MEVTQIAACNRLHEVDERLARWLLMSQDRIRLDELPLTKEFLAQMLGTRRASVSVSANILQNFAKSGPGSTWSRLRYYSRQKRPGRSLL